MERFSLACESLICSLHRARSRLILPAMLQLARPRNPPSGLCDGATRPFPRLLPLSVVASHIPLSSCCAPRTTVGRRTPSSDSSVCSNSLLFEILTGSRACSGSMNHAAENTYPKCSPNPTRRPETPTDPPARSLFYRKLVYYERKKNPRSSPPPRGTRYRRNGKAHCSTALRSYKNRPRFYALTNTWKEQRKTSRRKKEEIQKIVLSAVSFRD